MVQLSRFPTWFLPCAGATPPSASSPLGFCTLTGVSACLYPVCWSTPEVGLVGSLLRHLVFSHVPGSSSGPAAWAAFPAAGYLVFFFRSPGVCPSASLVAWVRLQPFPSFSGLLLLRLLAGVVGVLHPVSGCSSCEGVCLVCRCDHPAALPLP